MNRKSFCFESQQVERLSQLVKHELIKLDIISQRHNLTDSSKLYLEKEYVLYENILNILLNRG